MVFCLKLRRGGARKKTHYRGVIGSPIGTKSGLVPLPDRQIVPGHVFCPAIPVK